MPENLHACQFRQTSDLHNSPHWTIHAAISTIAAISSLRSPPRHPSCIKQVRAVLWPRLAGFLPAFPNRVVWMIPSTYQRRGVFEAHLQSVCQNTCRGTVLQHEREGVRGRATDNCEARGELIILVMPFDWYGTLKLSSRPLGLSSNY